MYPPAYPERFYENKPVCFVPGHLPSKHVSLVSQEMAIWQMLACKTGNVCGSADGSITSPECEKWLQVWGQSSIDIQTQYILEVVINYL